MSFCLVPKIFNSVNMVMLFCKMCAVIDSKMTEFTHIQYVVTSVTVCINDAVWLNLLADYGQQSGGLSIRYRNGVNLAITL